MVNLDINKDWQPGKYYKQRKFDPNLFSLKIPLYQMNQFHGRIGFIFNGRQIVPKKIPKNSDYFIDKHFGMFHIDYEKHFIMGKCEIYFFDSRNQNSFDPRVANKLYQWANKQGNYKIKRSDVKHAIRLRSMKEAQKANPEQQLADQLNQEKRDIRKFCISVQEEIKKKNEQTEEQRKLDQGDKNSDEYQIIDEDGTNKLIIKNLYDNGYIDEHQKNNLDWKLKKHEIQSTEELLKEIDSFTDLMVTEPISHEMERFLDDYHTYKPHNVIMHISALHKIRKGVNKLRTKAVINWFPSMYLLFGALGVGVVYILYTQYADQGGDLGSIIPGT